jgi:molybdate transport system substrate-binding protein
MRSAIAALWKLAAAAALIGAASAQAAEIKLVAAAEMRALLRLVPAFEKASGHKIKIVWESEPTTKEVVEHWAADAALIPAPDLDRLIAAGVMLRDSRMDVAKSPLGLAVREGIPKPDISSAEAVRKAVLSAKSIVHSSGPSGAHLAGLFEKMGIADRIKDKIERKNFRHRVTEVLMVRRADLGFDLVSELMSEGGNGPLQFVGPLPSDIQYITVFAAAIRKTAAAPDAAKALLKFLAAPEAAAVIRQFGMEPG